MYLSVLFDFNIDNMQKQILLKKLINPCKKLNKFLFYFII